MRRGDDDAVSAIIASILILGILGVALVYVDAYYVPRQGVAGEVAARDSVERGLLDLASSTQGAAPGPITMDLPLQAQSERAPLLYPIVHTPVVASGELRFEPNATLVTWSVVTFTPPEGAPANDPMVQDLGGGLMRVYLLGNATSGFPVGSLVLSPGAAYLETATYRLEAGAVLVDRGDTSALVAGPGLQLGTGGSALAPTTSVAWQIPLLAGAASQIGGASSAEVSLSPGPIALVGGGQAVVNATLRIETGSLEAWRTALAQVVGAHGNVTSVTTSGPDAGIVTATILPPAGTPPGAAAVTLDARSVRYALDFAARAAG